MSLSNPLAEWHANFNKDVQTLRQLMLLRTRRGDIEIRDETHPLFQSVADSLAELENAVSSLSRYIQTENAELARLQAFQRALATQVRRAALVKENVPEELQETLGLRGNVDAGKPEGVVAEVKEEDAGDENAPPEENVVEEKPKKAPSKGRKKVPAAKSRPTKKITSAATEEPCANDDAPCVRNVTQEDLDAAPQYVRGRLTVEKISGVVTKLNAVLTQKYALLAKPYRELSSVEITQKQDMQDAECPETADRHFLTDVDIRVFGGHRMDATVKSAINMLRHTGALKEVRGKNKTRIFIVN